MSRCDGPVVNVNEFRVVGMSRSGNHAIINWILRQVSGRYCFLNCAEPKFNPFTSARPLLHGRPYMANYDGFDIEAERRGEFSQKDYLIHSYEDCFLGMLSKPVVAERHDDWVGRSRRRLNVLILRDPFNLFASRRKSGFGEVSDAVAQRIWKQHAREFIGFRRYLDDPLVCINYNAWVTDRAYRADVACQLGLTFDDAGADSAPDFGPASAFASGNRQQWPVLRRWLHYEHDAIYRRLFEPGTVALAERIFGSGEALKRRLLCG